MTKAESTKKLLQAMSDFGTAYSALRVAIDEYEQETGASVNDLQGFTEGYPFDKSFDELSIGQWVADTIEGVKKSAFKVLNYEYLNTGGNTMVGIFEVWLPAIKQTVYVYTNEEGYTMSAVDYIRNELEIDDYDELMLEYGDWGRVTGYEKYFELYRYCLNAYTKSDCKYFGYTRQLPRYLLSDELQSQIIAEYQQWMDSNEYDTFETDGVKIIVSPDYESATDDDRLIASVKEFQRWHESIGADERYYDCEYTLTFADKKLMLPFVADVWDAIENMLVSVIRNY